MNAITPLRTAAETAIGEAYRSRAAASAEPAAVRVVRDAAAGALVNAGLPHRRVEAWRYTDLRARLRTLPRLAVPAIEPADVPLADPFAAVKSHRVAILDGAPLPFDAAALPEGLTVTPLRAHLAGAEPAVVARLARAPVRGDDATRALNLAFAEDGLVIEVGAGVEVALPVLLSFARGGGAASFAASRVHVTLGEGAGLTLIEAHVGADGEASLANVVVDAEVGEGASLHHLRLHLDGSEAVALSAFDARLAGGAKLTTVNFVTGVGLSRHENIVRFDGEEVEANLGGITLGGGMRHADHAFVVDHAHAHGDSREVFRTVLDDEATAAFQGKIIVRPHAQKVNAKLKSDALLLSEGATMSHKPELEIHADDVLCGHGATVGSLDEDLLFYLRSRGIPKAEAEALLIRAYVGAAIELVEREDLREVLSGVVEAWVAARGAGAREARSAA